jgi:hypothetical protein
VGGGWELARGGGLAVAGEGDVGHASQVRGDGVERRLGPEPSRGAPQQLLELADEAGHVDARGATGGGPVDLAVRAVEVAGLVGIQVDADREPSRPPGDDRVDVAVLRELAPMIPVVETAGPGLS